MPELPEVETIKRGLESLIVGKTISNVKVLWGKTFHSSKKTIQQQLIGRKVQSVERQAKLLLLNISSQYTLMFHLKLTGQVILTTKNQQRLGGGHPTKSMVAKLPDKSTRVIFDFNDGSKLYFNDQRKFGWIKLVKTSEVANDPLINRLGPEPLSRDFTIDGLQVAIRRHSKLAIKGIILDQSTLSGIGNIYADESLNLAKIHPGTKGAAIKPAQIRALYKAIKQILQSSIKHGGSSITHYVNVFGKKGDYLERARVFRRAGESCRVCGGKIVKIRVVGRGTYICPRCQKLSRRS